MTNNLKFNSDHEVIMCKMNLKKWRKIRKIKDDFGKVEKEEVRYNYEINKRIKIRRRGAKI